MATTPEGKVKKAITAVLKKRAGLWYNMPVPYGYGQQSLDYIGCYKSYFFAIEAKAPGRTTSSRQDETLRQMREAGAKTFVIDGPAGIEELEQWMDSF
jgi:hypothetical protein